MIYLFSSSFNQGIKSSPCECSYLRCARQTWFIVYPLWVTAWMTVFASHSHDKDWVLRALCIVPAITFGRKADSEIRRWWCWVYLKEGSGKLISAIVFRTIVINVPFSFLFLFFLTFHWILPKLHHFECAPKDRFLVFKSKQSQTKPKHRKDLRIMKRHQQEGLWKILFWWMWIGERVAKAVLQALRDSNAN